MCLKTSILLNLIKPKKQTRDFLEKKKCSITKRAGSLRKMRVDNGALAAWDMVELRCRKLKEVFYAAMCRNSYCNIANFGMKRPIGVALFSKPVFASRRISGMRPRKTVLVPIACSCQAREVPF